MNKLLRASGGLFKTNESFTPTLESRLESDFSAPNVNSSNTLSNDLAALARYLFEQGLGVTRIAEALEIDRHTANKWAKGKYRLSDRINASK